MSQEAHYSMLVQWSEPDQAFVVILPEWDDRVFNPVTHGETYEEAVSHGRDALEALVAAAEKHGETLPRPQIRGQLADPPTTAQRTP